MKQSAEHQEEIILTTTKPQIDKKSSTRINFLKFLAIFFVICAHSLSGNFSLLDSILGVFGVISMPLFLFLAGYCFDDHNDKKKFLLKKITRIIIPWIIWGLVTYFANVFMHADKLKALDLILWLIGYGTWLYFVPIILFCYFLFIFIKNEYVILALSIVSVLSIILTGFGISFMNNYLNPLNWICFFGFGILCRNHTLMQKAVKLWIYLIIFVIWTTCFILYVIFLKPTYFIYYSLVFELLSIFFLTFIKSPSSKVFEFVSKNTFFIYFFHMQFGLWPIKYLLKIFSNNIPLTLILSIATPFLCLSICLLVLFVLFLIFRKNRFVRRILLYFGVRV